MLDRPIAFYRVNSPVIVAGLHAGTGDMLIFWPGHPTHTLSVREWGTGSKPLRRFTHVADGIVYGALLELLNDDVIVAMSLYSATVVQLSAEPVPSAADW